MSVRFIKNITPASFPTSTKFIFVLQLSNGIKAFIETWTPVFSDAAHTEDLLVARVTTFTSRADLKCTSVLNEKGLLGSNITFACHYTLCCLS